VDPAVQMGDVNAFSLAGLLAQGDPLFTPQYPRKPYVAPVQLKIDVQMQERSAWCWAAVGAAIAEAYGDPVVEQCGVAKNVVGHDCCPSGLQNGCNTAKDLPPALGTHFVDSSPDAPRKEPDFIKRQIDHGFPIAVRIEWTDTRCGHFVLISGYLEWSGNLDLSIDDPSTGTRAIWRYEHFRRAYHNHGDWNLTFTTTGVRPVPRV
jgi:hypothetical protein